MDFGDRVIVEVGVELKVWFGDVIEFGLELGEFMDVVFGNEDWVLERLLKWRLSKLWSLDVSEDGVLGKVKFLVVFGKGKGLVRGVRVVVRGLGFRVGVKEGHD